MSYIKVKKVKKLEVIEIPRKNAIVPKVAEEPLVISKHPVWEQQPGEDDFWYNIFFDFFLKLTVGNRSAYQAYQIYRKLHNSESKACKMPMTWPKASEIYQWEYRGHKHWQAQILEQYEYHKAKKYEAWENRYKIAEEAQKKALEMLKFPISQKFVTQRYSDGRPCQIVIKPTANWSIKDAMTLAEKSLDILRDIENYQNANFMIEQLEKMGFKVLDPSEKEATIEVENLLEQFEK